jgi:hypothetical protein
VRAAGGKALAKALLKMPAQWSEAFENVDAGHFWSMGRPEAVIALIRKLLDM